jgi:predicted MFS family arabinose efflux permease
MAAIATLLLVCVVTAVATSVFHLTAEQIVGGALLQLVIWGWLFSPPVQH